MRVLDIEVDDLHAGFEHLRDIAKRLRRRRVEARGSRDLAACAIGDVIAVEVEDEGLAVIDRRRDVFVAVTALGSRCSRRARSAAARRDVGPAWVEAAERAVLRAMDRDALEIGDRHGRDWLRASLNSAGEPDRTRCRCRCVGVLEFDIGDREGADVAAGAGERNPGRRMSLAALVDHLRNQQRAPGGVLVDEIGPIGKRRLEMRRAGRIEEAEAVADAEAEFLAIDAGQRRSRCPPTVCEISGVWWLVSSVPFCSQEIQQAGNLLEIGRHVRIVAAQMDVVELQIDDVLELVTWRPEMATCGGVGWRHAGNQERQERACRVMSNPVHLDSPMFCWIGARGEVIRGAREPGEFRQEV